MCGIIGVISESSVVKDLTIGLKSLEYRGYDSWGMCILNDRLSLIKDVGRISEEPPMLGNLGIGHVRWATHGKPSKENAHPFFSCHQDISIVHNGIIENFEELKDGLTKDGHKFTSQTDSEVIVHLIERYCELWSFPDAFEKAVQQLKGQYAILAIHEDYHCIMAVRKDMPLMIGATKDSVYIASDRRAIPCESVKEILEEKIESFTLEQRNELSSVKIESSNHDNYPNFMLKEIEEQPATFLQGLQQDRDKMFGVALDIFRYRNVIWTACGTSRYASILARYVAAKLAGAIGETIVGSELHYFENSFGDDTLILAVSQSGETADVITGVKIAKKKGSRIISFINKPYSTLERMSDVTIKLNCGEEIAVASTKAFTNELAVFYLLAFAMANQYEQGMKELCELPEKIRECLNQKEKIKKVANVIKDAQHIFYIGKGINFSVSGECALKLQEISYIHAESKAAGELKHGALSLIEDGTPVIGLCPDDYTYQETISNLHEAKTRNGLIIGISDRDNDVFDYWLPIPKVRDIYYPLLSVIIGQLLAYYVATEKGIDPDFPKNLSKSVTVR